MNESSYRYSAEVVVMVQVVMCCGSHFNLLIDQVLMVVVMMMKKVMRIKGHATFTSKAEAEEAPPPSAIDSH